MSENKMKEYTGFFKEIEKFKEKQNKQKRRGLNDYNILTTVLEAHDEVRLHSRMIGSLLNPDGLHYQNTLFLEKFLDELALDNFEMDLNNIKIEVEYKNIDLYITDGNKHIIIENKIWAEDQPCQIIKYINIIKEEYSLDVDENNIIHDMRVIYLTPQNKAKPVEHIIDENYISFSGGNNKLIECSKRDNTKVLVPNGLKNYNVLFKKINYKNNILDWLNKCKKVIETRNIINLDEVFRQYIDVVNIICKNHKSKVDSLEEYLIDEIKKDNKMFYNGLKEPIHYNGEEITIIKDIENAKNNFKNNIYKRLAKEFDSYFPEYNEKNYLNLKVNGINLHFTHREDGYLLCNIAPNNKDKAVIELLKKILTSVLQEPKNKTEFIIEKIALSNYKYLLTTCEKIVNKVKESTLI